MRIKKERSSKAQRSQEETKNARVFRLKTDLTLTEKRHQEETEEAMAARLITYCTSTVQRWKAETTEVRASISRTDTKKIWRYRRYILWMWALWSFQNEKVERFNYAKGDDNKGFFCNRGEVKVCSEHPTPLLKEIINIWTKRSLRGKVLRKYERQLNSALALTSFK